jgi:hypothetical protein
MERYGKDVNENTKNDRKEEKEVVQLRTHSMYLK